MNLLNNRNANLILTTLLSLYLFSCSKDKKDIPAQLSEFIENIQYDEFGYQQPEIGYEVINDSIVKVTLKCQIEDTLFQDDWRVIIYPKFSPDFHWAPHLTPTEDHIIPQHVFRAPALIVSSEDRQLTIIPDLNVLKEGPPVDWYMDLDAPDNRLTLGLSQSKVREHVLYTRDSGAFYPPGEIQVGFYILTKQNKEGIFNPWRDALSFFWNRWGLPLYEKNEPLPENDLEPYVEHTYNWAFNSWKESVWQEFSINGKKVGAPVFIVNVTRSPNFTGKPKNREFTSIWNQAWFNSLRSAQGLYRYAKRTDNQELLEYALMTKELALSFPQKKGFFNSVIAPETEKVEKNGEVYEMSKGWDTYYFGNSNRNPYTWDPKQSPFHLLDMSFTAYEMLTWYDELEKDKRLLNYAISYADALIEIQDENGFFPGWLSLDSLKPREHLNQSPETSMSVTFLLKLYALTNDEKYLAPALKAMQAVIDYIIPTGRWEDFETYWSCSRYGAEDLVGKKVARNDMYKQNTFSMFWTAEALMACYQITKKQYYLKYGQRTLDELLMAQATWQPSYMYVHTLGGFGVMNGDAEWNDSRQSLFADLIIKYGKVMNKQEYIQRGLAALRASFVMMYCPENPETKKQWETKWPFFGKEDYGFMMENYGHDGVTGAKGVGIGEFTIYDWGNGAASEAYNRMVDRYGKDFLMNN